MQTGTGIWQVSYNAQNRAVRFENADSDTIIECAYDYMGCRFEKKVNITGEITLHERSSALPFFLRDAAPCIPFFSCNLE